MGSGLILLAIVGAWLAVLVPMALRSHDGGAPTRSAERFADAMVAMRAMTRRGAREVREVRLPRRPRLVVSATRSVAPAPVARAARPRASAAVRRRRTLVALAAAAVLCLLAGLTLSAGLLAPAAVAGVLLVAFVVHLRRQEVLRQAGRRRRAASAYDPEAPTVRRTAGIPDRMPARPQPLTAILPVPAARHDEPLPAAVAGAAWSPVPVPLPVYVGKPVAPRPTPRVLDLTSPGRWSSEREEAALLDDAPELDEILERRRAVGGW